MDDDPSRNFPKLIVYGCLSPPQILSPNIPNQPHGIRAVESGAISLQSLASGGAVSPRFVGAALFLGDFGSRRRRRPLLCVPERRRRTPLLTRVSDHLPGAVGN
jgi:hypothetical protein